MNRETELTVSEARSDFAQLIDRVHHRLDRVRVLKRGRPMVAIVPIEDLELLQRLEDAMDVSAAEAALEDPGKRVSLDRLREQLDL